MTDQVQKPTTALARMNVNERIQTLGKLIPEGVESKQTFLDLVSTQIMGVDNKGNSRPVEDLAYFLSVSKRSGLDPLAKQIHVVYRFDSKLGREKMSIQTGIDGLRLIAQRSNEYAGQDDVIYDSEENKFPKWAKVTVYRYNSKMGEKVPYSATARWDEYVATYDGKPGIMWSKMPYLMLGKVAEALALRKAFPQELSGLYTDDEMAQVDSKKPTSDLPTPDSIKKKEDIRNGGQEEITAKPTAVPPTEAPVQEAVIETPARKLKPDAIPTIGEGGEEVYKESDYEEEPVVTPAAQKAIANFNEEE